MAAIETLDNSPLCFLSPVLLDPLRRVLLIQLDAGSIRALRATCKQLRFEANAATQRLCLKYRELNKGLELHLRFPALICLRLASSGQGSPSAALMEFAVAQLPLLRNLRTLALVDEQFELLETVKGGDGCERSMAGGVICSSTAAASEDCSQARLSELLLLLNAPRGVKRLELLSRASEACLTAVAAAFLHLEDLKMSISGAATLRAAGALLPRLRSLEVILRPSNAHGDGEELDACSSAFCDALWVLTSATALLKLKIDFTTHGCIGEGYDVLAFQVLGSLPRTLRSVALICDLRNVAAWSSAFHAPQLLMLDGAASLVFSPPFADGAFGFTSLEVHSGCVAVICDVLHNQPAVTHLHMTGRLFDEYSALAAPLRALCCTHVHSLRLGRYYVGGSGRARSALLQSTLSYFGDAFASIFPNLEEIVIEALDGGLTVPGERLAGLCHLRRLVLPTGASLASVPQELAACKVIFGTQFVQSSSIYRL